MDSVPKVKAVMTPFPYSISIEEGLGAAQEMMEAHRIHHLPVKQDGQLVGTVTDREIKEALHPDLDPEVAESLTVGEVFVQESCVVDMNHPLDEVLEEMASRRIGSVLVVKEGRLAGIFTATDACRLFAALLRSSFPAGGGEAA